MAAGDSVDIVRWKIAFDELMGRIAGRFGWTDIVASPSGELPR
ncbi:hypothetical protein [Streptosporangium lutulentum]